VSEPTAGGDDLWETHAGWWQAGFSEGADPEYVEQIMPMAAEQLVGATSVLDVGAAPGTNVYSPVDGTVVGITPYVVGGKRFGTRIDIQPQSAPSYVVSLTQLRADPSLTVGANVVSGATRLGTVVNLALVERQALSRYTNDSGNHVSVELHPAVSLVLN
jgi:hypothetical protein